MSYRAILCSALCAVTLMGWGCNQKTETAESDLPAWMSDGEHGQKTALHAGHGAVLSLNLEPGTHFPLRKIVNQELVQSSVTGTPQKNNSRLEIMMAISVLEKRGDRTRLGVRYDRVQYQHQIADESVVFDSLNPASEIPLGVVAYRDMINDGFAFWIGADNRIVEVEGFKEFMDRSLRNIPPENQQEIVQGIEASSGDTGIANFVDNTIGLLPFGKKTTPGDSWQREYQLGRPMPMYVNNTYTLTDLTGTHATIDVQGTISPGTSLSGHEEDDVKILVNGGSTRGQCTVFVETGLPKESRIDRVIDMTVVMDNTLQFRQTKRVTTTIESFPPMKPSTPPVVNASRPQIIQQVSGTRE